MSRLHAAIDALTSETHPETTLLAFTTNDRTGYPDGATEPLDRDGRKQLRRVERSVRAAMRMPPADRYSVLAGPAWHVVLAPHAAPVRLYLARAGKQHHYQHAGSQAAPMVPPATLLAAWGPEDRHEFAHVSTLEQLNLLMHYSTAASLVYVTPTASQSGQAVAYELATEA